MKEKNKTICQFFNPFLIGGSDELPDLYLKVVESEKTAKWQYTRHCEDLSVEIKKLREEVEKT